MLTVCHAWRNHLRWFWTAPRPCLVLLLDAMISYINYGIITPPRPSPHYRVFARYRAPHMSPCARSIIIACVVRCAPLPSRPCGRSARPVVSKQSIPRAPAPLRAFPSPCTRCTQPLFFSPWERNSMLEEMNKMNDENAALRAEKQELAARIRQNDPAQAKRPFGR